MSRPPVARALAIAAAGAVILGLLVSWFAWPATQIAPRDLPIVVAGPAPAAAAIAEKLRTERPGAFEVTLAPDAASADAALRARTAYAAFVISAGNSGAAGLDLHTASAASPTVSTLLTQAAAQLGGGIPVTVVDVVPGPADDPRGAGFAAGFLPLILVSLISAVLASLVVPGKLARLLGLAVFAVLAGLVGAAVLGWLGAIDGSYLAAAGVISLSALAIGSTLVGLATALGRAGIPLGVLLVFLLGNPISGVAAAPELLPQPWGAVGQLMPPGADATLLRSALFFDGAGAGAPLWTLVIWTAIGLLLLAVGRNRPIIRPEAARTAGTADALSPAEADAMR